MKAAHVVAERIRKLLEGHGPAIRAVSTWGEFGVSVDVGGPMVEALFARGEVAIIPALADDERLSPDDAAEFAASLMLAAAVANKIKASMAELVAGVDLTPQPMPDTFPPGGIGDFLNPKVIAKCVAEFGEAGGGVAWP